MATSATLPVSEYLTTFYKPDCDYVDGEVEERCLGGQKHGTVQAFFTRIFGIARREWQIWVVPEQRIHISPTRYRVADICVRRSSDPPSEVIQVPPLLCIEVISPGQSFSRIQAVLDDYVCMGVENVWIIDPELRRAWTADARGLNAVREELRINGTPICVPLADIWAELDELARTGQ